MSNYEQGDKVYFCNEKISSKIFEGNYRGPLVDGVTSVIVVDGYQVLKPTRELSQTRELAKRARASRKLEGNPLVVAMNNRKAINVLT